MSATNRITV